MSTHNISFLKEIKKIFWVKKESNLELFFLFDWIQIMSTQFIVLYKMLTLYFMFFLLIHENMHYWYSLDLPH